MKVNSKTRRHDGDEIKIVLFSTKWELYMSVHCEKIFWVIHITHVLKELGQFYKLLENLIGFILNFHLNFQKICSKVFHGFLVHSPKDYLFV